VPKLINDQWQEECERGGTFISIILVLASICHLSINPSIHVSYYCNAPPFCELLLILLPPYPIPLAHPVTLLTVAGRSIRSLMLVLLYQYALFTDIPAAVRSLRHSTLFYRFHRTIPFTTEYMIINTNRLGRPPINPPFNAHFIRRDLNVCKYKQVLRDSGLAHGIYFANHTRYCPK
jgi:hypothetical protein